MRPILSRRMVIAGCGAALAAAGLVSWAAFGRPKAIVRGVLWRRLPGLRIPPEVADAFYREFWPAFAKRLGREKEALVTLLELAHPLTDRLESRSVELAEREIVTAFLLGSDYFTINAPADRRLTWVGLAQVCQNPFRRA